MKRTTIFVGEETLYTLREIAQREQLSTAEVIRRALDRFIAERRGDSDRKIPSILGIGQSGRTDIADRFEELLWKDDRHRKRAAR